MTSEKIKEIAAVLDLSDANRNSNAGSSQPPKKESLTENNDLCGNVPPKIEPD